MDPSFAATASFLTGWTLHAAQFGAKTLVIHQATQERVEEVLRQRHQENQNPKELSQKSISPLNASSTSSNNSVEDTLKSNIQKEIIKTVNVIIEYTKAFFLEMKEQITQHPFNSFITGVTLIKLGLDIVIIANRIALI